MTILHIEHPIRDFDTWKKAFESDPAGREKGGVRSYQVFRPVDDPNYVRRREDNLCLPTTT